nr:neural Wiskott-Aldrich syndrome protein-like [Onthophagus taurus]
MKKLKKLKNVESLLLSRDENLKIFELLGYGCESKSTAIVQLFQTEHPKHDEWIKHHTGIVCLIKDYNLKTYFFRLYCFDSCTLIWEYKIPPAFSYVLSAKFLHTFIGEGCAYGLSFTDEIEASSFFQSVQEIVKKIKIPKQTGTIKKIKRQDTTKKSFRKNHRFIISNPVEFKHVQHYGFSDWRELDTKILKLSGKNETSNGDESKVISPRKVTFEDEVETNISTTKPKEESQFNYFEDEVEINISTPKPKEESQFNFMAELNSKIDNKQIRNEEENFSNFCQTLKVDEDKEFLTHAIINRHRNICDDSSDSDSDNWD